MQRRNFIQTFLASIGIGATAKALPAKAAAVEAAKSKRLVLFVRPQDYHEWLIRTQCTMIYTSAGPVQQKKAVLRYDAAQNRLWHHEGDMGLPQIAEIRVCPKLVTKEERSWRVECVAA